MDPDRHLQMINPAACRFLGYSEQELIGQPAHVLFKEADALAAADVNRELHFVTKQGATIPILFSRSILKDKDGLVTGIIGVAKDLTERKAAEERLAHSNRELQDFASIASHDLQEPLRKVQVFGDRLKLKMRRPVGRRRARLSGPHAEGCDADAVVHQRSSGLFPGHDQSDAF